MRRITTAIFLFVLAVLAVLASSCDEPANKAEAEARKYAEKHNWEVKTLSCTNQDSDDDGYATCSIKYRDLDEQADLRAAAKARGENEAAVFAPLHKKDIECAASWGPSTDSGCKDKVKVKTLLH
jgi:hypothetical protein